MHRDAGETQELTDNLRGRLREARTAPEALRALLNSLQDAGVRGAGLAGWTAGHWTAGQWNAGPGTAAAPDLRDGTWTVTPLAFTDPPAALYLPAPAAGTPAAHLEALLTLTGQALRRIAREDSSAPPTSPPPSPRPAYHRAAGGPGRGPPAAADRERPGGRGGRHHRRAAAVGERRVPEPAGLHPQ
ncbi:hypothetical protein [Deinococcus aquaticus]|uniref:hypothetical protein n=1 Tax=Deinococcus aquaticus TaxID=328692 RepID=UPI003618E37A